MRYNLIQRRKQIKNIISEQDEVQSEEDPPHIQRAKERVPSDQTDAVKHMANQMRNITKALGEYTRDRTAFGHLHGDHPKIDEFDKFIKHGANSYIDDK